MKQYLISGILLWILTGLAAAPCYASCCGCTSGEWTIATGLRSDFFTDDGAENTDGQEFTIPFGVTYRRKPFTFLIESAYSQATVEIEGSDRKTEASIDHLADTRLSFSFACPDVTAASEREQAPAVCKSLGLPVGFVLGVDLNLPTGKEQLDLNERMAEAGENNDLFETDDFGQGTNVGLSAGIAKTLGRLSLGLNGSYLFKNEYDPTSGISNDTLDPGDLMLTLAQAKWLNSWEKLWMTVETFMVYAHSLEDKEEGQKTFHEGDKWVFGGAFKARYHQVRLIARGQYTWQDRNKEWERNDLGEKTEFGTEPQNSNGASFFGLLEVQYKVSPRLVVGGLADIRYYSESQRQDAGGTPYEGKRVRYGVGPSLLYDLSDHLVLNALVKYISLTQEADISTLKKEIQGGNISVGFTYTF